ncbi:hypothetical protein JTE90_018261 [Oedothorax gibbosus]|uniref:Uncharacterized protein n=1 Tax=Oedothorax gibbosus TaxID=931172 RepID=A0AAV6U8W5_9ARAC|nr:hypothetical protein JTE90_018261 [Oedothorax gibbosus]KAG8180644.1 hypothetical protein JTE90_018261 [Oedothorax gibbosus]
MTSVRIPPAQEGLAFSLTWRMQLHYLTLTANEWRTQKMFCKFYAKTYVTTWYLAPCNVSFRLRGRYNRHMRSHRPHNHETEIQESFCGQKPILFEEPPNFAYNFSGNPVNATKCDDDVDEPCSEISVLFEEMPMGDVSEAWLYDDDDDEVMGVLTQNFVEIPDDEVMGVLTQNPLPEQIGGGIDTPHRDFWTPMPIDDTSNLEKAIVLSEKRRRRNPRFNVEEVSYDALVDCDRIPQSSRGMPLISIIEVVRLLFHVLL